MKWFLLLAASGTAIGFFGFGAAIAFSAVSIYEDTVIDAGEYWDVEVYDNAQLTVTGGKIDNRLQLYETSKAEISGGWVNALYLESSTRADLQSGAFINTYISTRGTSVLDIFGGRMPDRWLNATDQSNVNMYVRSFSYLPAGDGRITGIWADNASFGVDLNGSETYSHISIHIVPEPSPLILLCAGAISILAYVWRRQKRMA